VRALWADRLERGGQAPEWIGEMESIRHKPYLGVVLGIDPSLRGTGLSILSFRDSGIELLRSHTIRLKSSIPMPICIGNICKVVGELLGEVQVDHVAMEQPIYVQNTRTALVLGAARGAAMAAVVLKEKPVFEYAPLRVKQAVAGFGRASKEQVARSVRSLMGLNDVLKSDEADAAAVAICHAFTHRPVHL
tara:strand:- start:6687 stop:7259 length:573 start_codon:yes stop_codon:yes gene_type:complete